MQADTTTTKQFSKLRGRFNSFEETSSVVNDAQKFYDQLTRRDPIYCHSDLDVAQKWLVSKPFDLLFVCGLAPWIFGAVAMFVSGGPNQLIATPAQQMLTIFLVGASFMVGESHQFTSIIRYYSKTFRQRRKPYRWHRVPIWILYGLFAIVAVAAAGAMVFNFFPFKQLSDLTVALFAMPVSFLAIFMGTLFPAFLMQHFCGQAKAVGLIYCTNNQFYLSDLEKLALSVVSWLLVLAGVMTIAVPFFGSSPGSFFNIDQFLKPDAPFHLIAILVARYSVLFMVIHYMVRGIKNHEWLPAGAALTWINMTLFTLVPTSWMLYVWLFVPVFFHATQHWTIAWSTQQNEIRRERVNRLRIDPYNLESERSADLHRFYRDFRRLVLPVQLLSVVVLFGTLIWQHLWGNLIMNGPDVTLGAVLSILVFYCHYFTDRIVWRPTN